MLDTEQQTNSRRPALPADAVASAYEEAMDRSRALFSVGLRLLEAETARFVNELTTQGQATFEQLCACRTPMELLSLEQEWLNARSRLYLEFGLRFAAAFNMVARATGWNGS